jgi:tripartite-type tricarboxylate transporter receptor subunit TctC
MPLGMDGGKPRRPDMQNLARGAGPSIALFLVAPFLAAQISAAQAQDAAAFFKGRNVNMEIGYSAGGGYDVYARSIARFMGKHIASAPNVIPKNMQGAGSLRLANWLYTAAPKDGTEIGTIGRGIAFDPLLGNKNAQFDPAKFTWLGSATNEVSVCVVWRDSGIAKFDDLYTKPMTVGGTGGGADTDVFPQILNAVLGTKMKMIAGYPGGNDVNLAMERGEVQGRCGWSWSSVQATHRDWLAQKKIAVLVQLALSKHPDLPDVHERPGVPGRGRDGATRDQSGQRPADREAPQRGLPDTAGHCRQGRAGALPQITSRQDRKGS